ncbi:gluconate 2-dehydrogenase subunit 3 family protein [Dyadobacter pollutisoli]|uniref:Gluconate 2-dehydrogenase subunit 3 family protein n=1 Tax=Dyadobacter pollutisoli TaxID=2910158 RepID=A0A9E8NB20_9BACT|nr:gluconate 2-dehydrogenase subunit 3 family protein [Dyadobacter pollutisoli]WAC12043.1 gluconate 2-dehydrogenase subunit 3 family protein [Dyadobacter pollutisoli]
MERRVALKSMAVAMGAMAGLPAWASGWSKGTLPKGRLLSADQSKNLAAIVEAIIPKTDTPGAGELGVGDFVQKMVKDCYDSKAQASLASGVSNVDEQSIQRFGKSFVDAGKDQKLQILQDIDKGSDASQKAFLGMVKNLTIQGYMTSEYVMTNITHYEMIPGRYHGCVPVKKG